MTPRTVPTEKLDLPAMISSIPLLTGYVPADQVLVLVIDKTTRGDEDGTVIYRGQTSLVESDGHLANSSDLRRNLASCLAVISSVATEHTDTTGHTCGVIIVAVTDRLTEADKLCLLDDYFAVPLRYIGVDADMIVVTDTFNPAGGTTTATVALPGRTLGDDIPDNVFMPCRGVPLVHWTSAPGAAELIARGTAGVYPDYASWAEAVESTETTDDN